MTLTILEMKEIVSRRASVVAVTVGDREAVVVEGQTLSHDAVVLTTKGTPLLRRLACNISSPRSDGTLT